MDYYYYSMTIDLHLFSLQALILEKSVELERLRIQYDSLKKIEVEQLETIEHLSVN